MGTVRDMKLDPLTGDITLSGGDLAMVSDGAAIVQAVKIRLQFFRGEWYLDLDAGIPYFQSVLVKNPNPNALQTIFRDAILETPGVSGLTSLQLTFDRATRRLAVAFRVTTDLGELDGSTEV